MANFTWAQIKDWIGDPVVFLTLYDPRTKKTYTLTDADIPPATVQRIVDWVNAHLS